MLDRKRQRAEKALEELTAYAEDRGAGNALDESRHLARQMLGQTYKCAAGKALRALEVKGLLSAEEHMETADERLAIEKENPEVFGMVQLYWFFRHECGLTGDESEVRVGRLRNAFWSEYGVIEVKYRAKGNTVESQGCEAVHIAVSRFKPNEGYKPGENVA